ncbi:MAG TPA: hypothetical protein VN794_22035 [Methylomirabilota bacterium]|nr:hypothetical protein [Methylomirabilota bacterium]
MRRCPGRISEAAGALVALVVPAVLVAREDEVARVAPAGHGAHRCW